MEIRKSYNLSDLERFYPVLRRQKAKPIGRKKLIKKIPNKPITTCTPIQKITKRAKAPPKPKLPRKKPEINAKVPKKPIKSKKTLTADQKRAKEQKKQERIEKMNGKLFLQLQMIDQRMNTMEKDKESYALVDLEKVDDKRVFTILRIGDTTKVLVKVDKDYNTSCSCMDWLIRCKNFAIPCKHIYYLLVKMLTYELFDYFDNTIQERVKFDGLVNGRIKLDKFDFKVNMNEDNLKEDCPVCFIPFKDKNNKDQILKCPDCRHCVHRNCMQVWLDNSKRRNCVICRSESWNNLLRI